MLTPDLLALGAVARFTATRLVAAAVSVPRPETVPPDAEVPGVRVRVLPLERQCFPLAEAQRKGHAIDAVLAVIARQQKGQVTVFTSDVDDLEQLVPDSIVVKKV